MQNFSYVNPCQIFFGDDSLIKIGGVVKEFGPRTLIVTGGGSVKRNGIFDIVVKSLSTAGVNWVEHNGVRSNPYISHAREGIELTRKLNPDSILAVGGGSVIDEAKVIASGALVDIDPWDFFSKKMKPVQALPVIAVSTIFGSGSEMNPGAVMTNSSINEKCGISAPVLIPRVAFLPPSAILTVPHNLVATGFIDAFSHVLEGYFNGNKVESVIQDSLSEAIFRSLIKLSRRLMSNPHDMDCLSDAMWTCCLAHNGQLNIGRGKISFQLHSIAHILGALFDIHHGVAISIAVIPWLRTIVSEKEKRLIKFGCEVFGTCNNENATSIVEKAISYLSEWISSMGVPRLLSCSIDLSSDESRLEAQTKITKALQAIDGYCLTEEQVSFLSSSML